MKAASHCVVRVSAVLLLFGSGLLTGCVSWTVNTKAGEPRNESLEKQNHVTAIKSVCLNASVERATVIVEATAISEYLVVEKRSVSGPTLRQRATFGLFPGSELVYKKNALDFKIDSYKERLGIFNLLNPAFLFELYCDIAGGGAVVAVCAPISTVWTTLVSPWYSFEGEASNEEFLYMGLSLFGCIRQTLPDSGMVTEVSESVSDDYLTSVIPLSNCTIEWEVPSLSIKNRLTLDNCGKATFKVNGQKSGAIDLRLRLTDVSKHEHSKFLSRFLGKTHIQQIHLLQ